MSEHIHEALGLSIYERADEIRAQARILAGELDDEFTRLHGRIRSLEADLAASNAEKLQLMMTIQGLIEEHEAEAAREEEEEDGEDAVA